MCSDLDYEEMVAIISYEQSSMAMITQENGLDNMEIEIFPATKEGISWKLPLNDFIKYLELAKKALIENAKTA